MMSLALPDMNPQEVNIKTSTLNQRYHHLQVKYALYEQGTGLMLFYLHSRIYKRPVQMLRYIQYRGVLTLPHSVKHTVLYFNLHFTQDIGILIFKSMYQFNFFEVRIIGFKIIFVWKML